MKYLIGIDCETGGLETESDLLTIYLSVIDENYNIVDELDMLLKPDNGRLPIAHADALHITGINLQEHLENHNTIEYSVASKKIIDMLKKYREKGKYSNLQVFGFNVRFDLEFIYKYLLKKADFEKLVHYKVTDVMNDIDFLKRHGWLPPTIGKLESCIDHFGLQKGKAHTAKDDVLMTIEVDKKIQEIMAAKKEGGQTMDLISLLEAE
jgi:oligoribonuclease (3'-5' exoribonuclease)